jgi:hypothetical protein
MQNINKALEAKKNITLNKFIRYNDEIITKREYIQRHKKEGAKVEISTKNRIQFNRIKFNRMCSNQEQQEYEKKCNEKIICYNLHPANVEYYNEITKTEFDYFNSLI